MKLTLVVYDKNGNCIFKGDEVTNYYIGDDLLVIVSDRDTLTITDNIYLDVVGSIRTIRLEKEEK